MRARYALLVPVVFLALAGCQSSCKVAGGDGASPAMFVNETCPIGKEPVTEDGGVAEHKGCKVGFCCPGCKEQWDAMSEADKDAFVAKARAGEV